MTSRSDASLVDRLLSHSVEVGDCLEWHGAYQSGTTPVINFNGRVGSVRRAIALESGVSLTRELVATYRCGNSRCVHPDHVQILPRSKLSSRVGKALDRSSVLFRGRMQRSKQADPRVKLSLEAARAIREKYAAGGGVTQRALAAEYGVTKYAVWRVVNGKTWRDFGSPFAQILEVLE